MGKPTVPAIAKGTKKTGVPSGRKLALCCVLLCLPLLFAACQQEISEQLIVEAVGVDRTAEGLRLTVQTLDAEQGQEGGAGSKSRLYTVTGETAEAALSRLTARTGKTPVYSHNRLLLLGETLAKEGYVPDFFIRSFQPRAQVLIAAAEGTAEKVLAAGGERLSARQMEEALLLGWQRGETIAPRLYEYLNERADPMSARRLPVFSVIEENGEKQAVPSGILLTGSDGRHLILDREESALLALLSGSEQALLTAGAEGVFSLRCTGVEAKSRLTLSDDGQPGLFVTLRIACVWNEYEGEAADAETVAEAAKAQLTARIEALWEKTARTAGLDALGLYPYFLKEETAYCQKNLRDAGGPARWQALLAAAAPDCDIRLRIERQGQSLSRPAAGTEAP